MRRQWSVHNVSGTFSTNSEFGVLSEVDVKRNASVPRQARSRRDMMLTLELVLPAGRAETGWRDRRDGIRHVDRRMTSSGMCGNGGS